jgi:hypothetical protein
MCLPLTPYKIEREWKHAGLSCAVVQGREAASRCGYVRVPPGHPAFGKEYDAIEVDVHGGLTFSEIEPCKEHEDGQGYWFGFDCAHFQDAQYDPNAKEDDPALSEETRYLLWTHREIEAKYRSVRGEHFWSQPEVERETEKLAEQLAAMVVA